MEKTDEMTYNERNIADFRASGGHIPSFGDAPVLLLTTTGAKSGLQRTNPLMYLADEENPDHVYVFASAAGADANPGWFHNLVAHPDSVKVEIGAAGDGGGRRGGAGAAARGALRGAGESLPRIRLLPGEGGAPDPRRRTDAAPLRQSS